MKNNILASLLMMAVMAMSGMVSAIDSTQNAEFEMHYMPEASGIAWSAWDNGVNAFVFADSEPKKDKKRYTIHLVQSLDAQTVVSMIVNDHHENGSRFQSYKIIDIDYDGAKSGMVKQKLQVERNNKMIYQRIIDVETQELVIEVAYNVKTNKSRVYQMVYGEWKKVAKYSGYATLRVHTENGILVSEVIPPIVN